MFGALLGGLAGLGEALLGSHSQRDANRTNIKLQREQQSWEERMSNTAITRAANDIERAGGNRALAFTSGREASTPSIAPARVEPTFRPSGNIAATAATAMQLKQMQAQTNLTNQQARVSKVEADIREELMGQEKGFRHNRFVEAHEWDDLKTKIQRNTATTTGLQAKLLEKNFDNLVRTAKAQADKGELNVKELNSIVETFGLGASEKVDIVTKVMRLIYGIMSARD